ncbi:MAG: O-methyltransferase [Bacilli bacterium]
MLEELEKEAKLNNIPIMQKDGIDFLTNFIKEKKINNILEIGTAIGYSAIKMALIDKDITIVTIERDNKRYKEAIKNIDNFKLKQQIKVINDDAFNVIINENFDLIFIDAAKSQSIKFFEKFQNNLNQNGFIITDNLHFHGLVNSDIEIKSRSLRSLIKKIKEYIVYLKENKQFETIFLDVGDGISISYKGGGDNDSHFGCEKR